MVRVRFYVPKGTFNWMRYRFIVYNSNIYIGNTGGMQEICVDLMSPKVINSLRNKLISDYPRYSPHNFSITIVADNYKQPIIPRKGNYFRYDTVRHKN